MNQFEEIKKHNLQKALLIETSVGTEEEKFIQAVEEVVDTLNKSFIDGLATEEETENDFKNLDFIIEKARSHKYYKREGAPGHYKYFYTKEQYDQAKRGSAGEDTNQNKKSGKEKEEVNKISTVEDIFDIQDKYGLGNIQEQINDGSIFKNPDSRDYNMAMSLLKMGALVLPEERNTDDYGNIIPGRNGKKEGTWGTLSNSKNFWERVLSGEIPMEKTKKKGVNMMYLLNNSGRF